MLALNGAVQLTALSTLVLEASNLSIRPVLTGTGVGLAGTF